MVGEVLALLSAVIWATVGVVLAALTRRLDTFTIAAARVTLGSLFLVPLLLGIHLNGGLGTVPPMGVVLLAVSGVVSLGIGDTLYVASLPSMGVARAHPISICLFPLFTFILALTLLNEVITLYTAIGSALIVGGVVLVVLSGQAQRNPALPRQGLGRGLALVVTAAALWAAGFGLLKVGAVGMNPAVAGFIRLSAAALALLLFLALRRRPLRIAAWGRRTWAGLAWTGAGAATSAGALIVLAVSYAGVAKVSVLVSTSPLFALPLALLFLGERVTWRTALGTAVAVLGTWLVLLG